MAEPQTADPLETADIRGILSTNTPAPQDPLESADIHSILGEPKNEALRSYQDVSDGNPDHLGKVLSIADKTGDAPEYVHNHIEATAREAQAPPKEWFDSLKDSAPKSYKALSDRETMALTKDDLHALPKLERMANSFKDGVSKIKNAAQYGLGSLQLSMLHFRDLLGNYELPGQPNTTQAALRQHITDLEGEQKKLEAKLPPFDVAHPIRSGVYGTIEFAPTLLAAGAAGAAMGPAGIPTFFGLQSAGDTYARLKEIKTEDGKPIPDNVARTWAAASGVLAGSITGAAEKPLANFLLSRVPGGDKLLARIASGGAEAVARSATFRGALWNGMTDMLKAEGLTAGTVAAFSAATQASIGGAKLSAGEKFSNVHPIQGALESIGAGVKGAIELGPLAAFGAGMGAIKGYEGYESKVKDEVAKATQSGSEALQAAAEASKLAQRNRPRFEKAVQTVLRDTPMAETRIPFEAAQAYLQSGKADPQAMLQELGAEKSYQDSMKTGDDLVVPTHKIIGTRYFQDLIPDIKYDQDGQTPNEAAREKELRQKAEEEANQKALVVKEQATKDADEINKADEATQRSRDSLALQIENDLQGAYKPVDVEESERVQQIKDSSALAASYYIAEAKRQKVDPLELYGQDREKFVKATGGEAAAAGGIEQSSPTPEDRVSPDEIRALFGPSAQAPEGAASSELPETGRTQEGGNQGLSSEGRITALAKKVKAPDTVEKIIAEERAFWPGANGSDEDLLHSAMNRSAASYDLAESVSGKIDSLSPQQARLFHDSILRDIVRLHVGGQPDAIQSPEVRDLLLRLNDIAARGEGPLFQQGETAPPFYSKLQKDIEARLPEKATVGQVQALLREAKEDERKWSGIDEFLKGKDKISKPELMEFLRANQLEVKEVEKGAPPNALQEQGWIRNENERLSRLYDETLARGGDVGEITDQMNANHDRIAELEKDESTTTTKYSDYQLPGSQNYRELLLTLPPQEIKELPSNLTNKTTKWTLTDGTERVSHDVVDEAANALYGHGDTPEAARANALQNINERAQYRNTFKSSHFDEPNILAHVRFNDRTDADGKKVLFLEEVQSDWHQKGRRQGYASDKPAYDKLPDRYQIQESPDGESFRVADSRDHDVNGHPRQVTAWHPSRESAAAEALNELNVRARGSRESQVPDAPFKKTWHEFALKRMLRYAAENGYDKLAWTTGEQQAERYDLSKQVESVHYSKTDDGLYDVWAKEKDTHRTVEIGEHPAERLPDVVGKDLADKIIAGQGEEMNPNVMPGAHPRGTKSLFGQDLKVGGEGMKGFYDRIIPSFLNKFGKKWGAQVEDANVSYGNEEELRAGRVVEAHTLPITDAIRNAALNEGFPLFQGERGFFAPDQKLIGLMKTADASTIVHEFAHSWLDRTFRFIQSGQADQSYLEHWDAAKKWLGVAEDQKELTRDQHEKFAVGFERFTQEGKAPTPALEGIFERFSKWITSVYRQMRGEALPEDVKAFFSRMVAGEDAVQGAMEETGYQPSEIAEMPDLEPVARNRLKDLQEKARAEAEHELVQAQLKDIRGNYSEWLRAERKRAEGNIKADVQDTPLYAAQDVLREAFGKTKKDDLSLLAAGFIRDTMSPDDQARFEMVAASHGFESGDQLAQQLSTAKPYEDEVKDRLAAHMEQFADMKNTEVLREFAREAVHSEKGTELLALEHRILEGMVHKDQITQRVSQIRRIEASEFARAAREQARDMLYDQPINRAGNPRTYITAERNAAMKVSKSLADGDKAAAFDAKRQQVFNHAAVSEAMKLGKKINSWIGYLAAQRTADPVGFKDEAHFVQINDLLQRFGMERSDYADWMGRRKETLAQWSDRMSRMTDNVEMADWIKNETIRKDYRDMTAGELQDLTDAIKNIKHVANSEDKVLSIWDKADLGEKVVELADAAGKAVEQFERESRQKPDTSAAPWQYSFTKLKDLFLWNRSAIKPETDLRMLQGFDPSGPWTDIYNSYARHKDTEGIKLLDARDKYRDIFSAYSPAEMRSMLKKALDIPELGKSYTKADLFMMLLNRGNDGNLRVLTEGRGFSTDDLDAALNAHLDKRDFDTAQKTWDWLESYRPEIGEMYKRVTGFEPHWVESSSFQTKFGTYRGGYFPLKLDPEVSMRAFDAVDADKSLNEAPQAAWRASTKNGFIKERSKQAKYVVSLDIGNVHRHVYDVIHDLAMREWVIDAQKVFGNRDVQDSVRGALGQPQNKKFMDWVRQEAGQNGYEGRDWYDNVLGWMRRRTMQSVIVDNVATMAMQSHSLFAPVAADPVNFGWKGALTAITQNMFDTVTNPMGHTQRREAREALSPYMKLRGIEYDRDVNEAYRRTWGERPIDDFSRDFTVGFMKKLDEFITGPIWDKAHEIGLNLFQGDQQKAADYADSLIRRSQVGGSRLGDLAPIFRSDRLRTFAMIGQFFNNVYNMAAEQGVKIQARPLKNMPELLSTGLALYVLPVVAKNFIHAGMPDDEEKRKEWAKGFLTYPADMVPFNVVKALADHMVNPVLDIPDRGWKAGDVSPAFGMLDEFVRLEKRILSPEATGQQKAEAATGLASYVVGYPRQFNSWFWNIADYVNNGMSPKPVDLMRRRPVADR